MGSLAAKDEGQSVRRENDVDRDDGKVTLNKSTASYKKSNTALISKKKPHSSSSSAYSTQSEGADSSYPEDPNSTKKLLKQIPYSAETHRSKALFRSASELRRDPRASGQRHNDSDSSDNEHTEQR